MSFIQHKKIKNKTYAYEVTSYWDKDLKKTRKHSKYIGPVHQETKEVIKFIKKNKNIEKLILDFGDGFFLYKFIKQSGLFGVFNQNIFSKLQEVFPMIIYRLCFESAMYNCENWIEGNIINFLFKDANLSSQRISEIFSVLGEEAIQRSFFKEYLNLIGGSKKSVIIDATSLPNHINIDLNAWGRSDGKIDKQFRLICVIDQLSKTPLFYRLLPGNITDVTTLQTTISELEAMGVENSLVLMDAGYFSESNICDLYNKKINFLSRMPAGRKIYNELILKKSSGLECLKNTNIIGTRTYFVKSFKIDLYGNKAYAYLILDPERKAKEIKELSYQYCKNQSERNEKKDSLEFAACGIMVLVSSKKTPASEILSSYYMRQSVEQVFGFSKSDLGLLPIRNHNEKTVKGYLFFQFLLLILYIKIRETLPEDCTVEQALLTLRKLKCKVFDNQIISAEQTKKQRIIFEKAKIMVPNFMGI